MKSMLGIALMFLNSFKIWLAVSLGIIGCFCTTPLYAKSSVLSFRILMSHLFMRFRIVLVLACVMSLMVAFCDWMFSAIRYVLSLYLRIE